MVRHGTSRRAAEISDSVGQMNKGVMTWTSNRNIVTGVAFFSAFTS
jgi:hypothetical protein